jgi:peptide/nickel transport system substrate-binding protein
VATVLAAACGGPGDAPGDEGSEAVSAGGITAAAFCGPVRERVDAWLAAHGDAGADSGDDAPATVVIAGGADAPGGMNAFATNDLVAGELQSHVNLMTLVRYDEALRFEPWLAESWEFGDDGGSLTFHLRDDVHWHDGERTDAYDVAFTFRRMSDPRTGYPNGAFWAPYLEGAGEAEPAEVERWGPGAGAVEVVDSLTVRFTFTPHPEPLDVWRFAAIMPEHLLADVAPGALATHPFGTGCPVGNGPFVFREHRTQSAWRFAANPAFPEALGGSPAVERLVYRVIPEASTLLAEFEAGRVHVYLSVLPDHVPRIRELDDARLESYLSRSVTALVWNARRPWFDDARVRRALSLALDREALAEGVLQGYGRPATSSVPPFHWAHDPSVALPAPDPERARRLLAEAGWRDGDGDGVRENADGVPLRFELLYSSGNATRRATAQVVRAQLARVGVAVEPTLAEYATLLERVLQPEPRNFDALLLGWSNDFRLDDRDLFHSASAGGAFGWAGTSDPELDGLLDSLQLAVDRTAAAPLWRRYQRRVQEVQPWSWLVYLERLNGVRRELRGVVMDLRGDLVGVHRWELEADAR